MLLLPIVSPTLAIAASLSVSLIAWRLRLLTVGGAAAATLVGTAVILGLGWPGALVLALFFGGSNLVSRLIPNAPTPFAGAKGDRRDAVQVLANGGVAAAGALIGLSLPDIGAWILTCSLASAAADTWATSIGARSTVWPRDILTRTAVPPGTNGGVTWYGTLGGIAGAAGVALTGAVAFHDARLFPAGVIIGTLGMLIDSLLGSRWQSRWLSNDGVNFLATLAAGLLGMLIGMRIS